MQNPGSVFPTVIITFDFELAWGSFDKAYGEDLLECARWTHDYGVPCILEHLARSSLSATWATVGALMSDRLARFDDLTDVSYPHFAGSWFQFIPTQANEANAPEWFGASIVRLIRETKPYQEIGFHSWSHVMFGDSGTPKQRARQELERCVALASELGFPPDSFVFPRNSIGYLDLLRETGFKCYRSEDRLRLRALGTPRTRAIAAILADVLALCPQIVHPSLNNGLVAIPGSHLIRYAKGWRALIPDACRRRRLREGLRRLCSEGSGVFNVWLHPENLFFGRPRLERILFDFIEEVRTLIDDKKVRCLTMGQLAHEYLESQAAGESSLRDLLIAAG